MKIFIVLSFLLFTSIIKAEESLIFVDNPGIETSTASQKLNYEIAAGVGLRYGRITFPTPLLKVSKHFNSSNIFLETTIIPTMMATAGYAYRVTDRDSFHLASFIGENMPEEDENGQYSKETPFYGFKIGYRYHSDHLDKSGWETSIELHAIKKTGNASTIPEYDTVPTIAFGYHWKYPNFKPSYSEKPAKKSELGFNLEFAYGVGLRYSILPYPPIPLVHINRKFGKSTLFTEAIINAFIAQISVGYAYQVRPNMNLFISKFKGGAIGSGFSGEKLGLIFYQNGADKSGLEFSAELYSVNKEDAYDTSHAIFPSVSVGYHWRDLF